MVSSHLAGCEKPLFILELLGVEFGASPDFLFGVGGAGEVHAAFLNESRTTSAASSAARQEIRSPGCPVFKSLSRSIAIVDLIDRPEGGL